MKFSTAALTFSFFAIVNSSVVTYSTEFGGNEEHKHDKYDCEIDTFDWKFALVVKEWKHHKDEKFCKDTDLDLVYEGDDGQLYHGCDGTYPYSKCKHCTNVFGGGDDDNKWDNKWKDDKGDDKWKDKKCDDKWDDKHKDDHCKDDNGKDGKCKDDDKCKDKKCDDKWDGNCKDDHGKDDKCKDDGKWDDKCKDKCDDKHKDDNCKDEKCDDKCKDDEKCHDHWKGDDKCDKHHCKYPYCEIHNTDCDLLITLCNGVLKDKRDATGEIAVNHQFQFDKPPQNDALHKKGFSIVHTEGTYYLALNHQIEFWHCKVDDKGLYKIYDKSIGDQCSKIELIVLKSDEKATNDDCDDDCKKKEKYD
ncbi:covalently-linked cell wall protein, putative [Candida dubliniensis CD36]|uniref:Covalently-linked cell wall protein, putative n=1 Tax=Candida dubliniensis (strain CD36 / ATCC MYA-646 / CBS 7987 / NCPF 3949 / NRRL Y-17841) TaxID=573826 RepID=B9WLX0_CANDC|nr:covalently-linked cell wall protein, putative [Candida dubliniensis CD36]CAX40082.1 covalently-linked cell wall protein, putative [Candida dubliniensis CD36]